MSEKSAWEDLRHSVGGHLPSNFSSRLIARAQHVQRRRRELTAIAATLLICMAGTGAFAGWRACRQHEANVALWHEYSALTATLERSL